MSTGGFHIDEELVGLAGELHDACSSADCNVPSNVLDRARAIVMRNHNERDATAYWIGTLNSCMLQAKSDQLCGLLEIEVSTMKAWHQQSKQLGAEGGIQSAE